MNENRYARHGRKVLPLPSPVISRELYHHLRLRGVYIRVLLAWGLQYLYNVDIDMSSNSTELRQSSSQPETAIFFSPYHYCGIKVR